jgi:hypothetical protein
MKAISDVEMYRRLDDLANNQERALTPSHYQKTIQAVANLLDAQKLYEEKPGFLRQQKVEWYLASVKQGAERLQLAYQLSYGPLDEVSGQQFWNVLKMQGRNWGAARSLKRTIGL